MTGGTEQTSRAFEAGLLLAPGPILVVEPDVVAEPRVAVAGLLDELVVPKRVALGLSAAVVSTAVDGEAEFAVVVPTGPGAAAFAFVGLEADPTLVPLAAYLGLETVPMVAEHAFAHEDGSMSDEHGSQPQVVLAPEVDSMNSGFESSMWVPEGTDVIPKEVGMGTDL